jgi:ATP synthase F1 delta subunit
MSLNIKRIDTYAISLFQKLQVSSSYVDKKSNLFIVGKELLLLRATLITYKKIYNIFLDPTYSENKKLAILLTIFPGLSLTTKSFLKILTEKNDLILLPEITEVYQNLLEKFINFTKVTIIISSELETKLGLILLKTLKNVLKSNTILLNIEYNPKILGGIIIKYNSMAIDASLLKDFNFFFAEV